MEEELATTDEILNNTKADGTTTLYLCVESIPSTGTVGGHVSIVIDTSGNGTSGVLIEGMPRDVESTCTDKITAPKQLLGEIDLLDEEKLEAVKDDVLRSIGNVTLPKVGTRACLQYIGLATNPRTVLSQMFEKARAIRGCCHNYDFLSEGAEAGYNSNAFAYTLMKLVEAHIEEGLPEKLVEVPVTPGWGQEIPDCDAAENGDRC
ncbi:MAG: hypothetical protein DWQ31_00440 [Planctomycetota bacterium]|nr:MAG: hypothetical protein DWQ31_00440 [Planctomycetota bacterium]REJ86658.1 MAG: hypothetical protein DWQ35_22780 [Planctomycetota bacterium]REK27169.1 MAG: hypothetical protein DWQ42_07635 [Planctomycetota bacterium]REK37834.1 MAG: hypothetical protein DWQ46_21470 [Planctomycetota bacterium]